MQSSSLEHNFSIHCTIFLPPIALRKCGSICNIEHILSRDFNVINDRCQQTKKKKEQIIQSNLICALHNTWEAKTKLRNCKIILSIISMH